MEVKRKFLIYFIPFIVTILSCAVLLILNFQQAKNETPRKESFNYFIYKNLIEEFPYSTNSSYSFYREYKKYKNQSPEINFLRSIPKWESLGPANIAGRTLSLAINPLDTNQLWMGSAGSGLWKSVSGGIGKNAWSYVPTGFPVISVSSIAIQSDQPQVMYIGTGEIYSAEGTDGGLHTRTLRGSRGIGILKSMDHGMNWTLVMDLTTNPQTSVWKIIIHPKNPDILYAATTIGVFKSTDGGTHWITSLDLPMATDMIIDHHDPNILFAGIGGIKGTHYGVYKSIDDGLSWKKVNSSNDTIYQGRIMLANYKSNPKRVYAAFSDKFKTIAMLRSNKGFDSSQFYLPIKDVCSYQGWYAKCLHIKDDDSSKLIMGGVDLYLDTTGTGNQLFNLMSWRIKIHADLHDIISNPLNPNIIYIATDGGLYRSDNFAKTFYSCNDGYISSQFYTGNISNRSEYLIGGLQDNKSALFTGTEYWNNIHLGDGCYNAFHPQDDSILYISSQYQNLYVSYNFGTSWSQLLKPNLNSAFVAPFIIHSKNPLRLYSGGNQLLTSDDGGKTWTSNVQLSKGEIIVAMEVSKNDPDQIFISTINLNSFQSNLYFSSNKGITLISKNSGIPNRFIRDIAINEENQNTMFASLGGNGQAGVIKSIEKGDNWIFPENKNLPDVPIHSVLIDPRDTNILYAGCEFGLFVSKNQGETWSSFNFHPYDIVPVYDIKYSGVINKLILFTHGYGVFGSDLVDISIPTKTTENTTSNIVIDADGLLRITYKFEHPTSLQIINLEGKIFILSKYGNGYSTKSLPFGLYFISSKKPELNGIKFTVFK